MNKKNMIQFFKNCIQRTSTKQYIQVWDPLFLKKKVWDPPFYSWQNKKLYLNSLTNQALNSLSKNEKRKKKFLIKYENFGKQLKSHSILESKKSFC